MDGTQTCTYDGHRTSNEKNQVQEYYESMQNKYTFQKTCIHKVIHNVFLWEHIINIRKIQEHTFMINMFIK